MAYPVALSVLFACVALPPALALPYDRENRATITAPPAAKRTPKPFDLNFPGIEILPGIKLLKGDAGLNLVETTVAGEWFS